MKDEEVSSRTKKSEMRYWIFNNSKDEYLLLLCNHLKEKGKRGRKESHELTNQLQVHLFYCYITSGSVPAAV
jgi:hypothetical protein